MTLANNKNSNPAINFAFVILASMAFVSGCGSSSGTDTTSQVRPAPAYQVGQNASVDPQNAYPYLSDQAGKCIVPESVDDTCQQDGSKSLSQLKPGPGFIGFPFGLSGTTASHINLDPQVNESISIYSGATATYTAKHYPVAVEQDGYTYFVFSGPATLDDSETVTTTSKGGKTSTSPLFYRSGDDKSNNLGIYIARYNHATDKVSAPLLVHAKNTDDPHDNAVINFDENGNLYILISGRSLIRSALLYVIETPNLHRVFEANNLKIKDITPDNLNYRGLDQEKITAPEYAGITYPKLISISGGFRLIYNIYCLKGSNLTCDGTRQLWSARLSYDPGASDKAMLDQVKPLAAYGGHYAVASSSNNGKDIVVAFNYLAQASAADRTNLYLLISSDSGETWQGIHPQSGRIQSVEDRLPLSQFSDLAQVSVLNVYDGRGTVAHRVYLKDVSVNNEGDNLAVSILFVGSTGPNSHPPTLENNHYLGLASLVNGRWHVRTISREIDHNYSSGFIHKNAASGERIFFPATPQNNNNALAGGAAAYLNVAAPEQVNYLMALKPVGESGYLTQLCEANYMRAVAGQQSDNVIGIGSAANPYMFESDSHHADLPASPMFLVKASGEAVTLPMRISEQDENGEMNLASTLNGELLNCDSSANLSSGM